MDIEKCLEYLSFGKSISAILIGSFSTNKSLNFVSISSHLLGSYIFLILESFCLAISLSLSWVCELELLSWVWESKLLSWVWESKLLSSLTTLLLSSPIFILLSLPKFLYCYIFHSKKTHLYFLINFFYFYKFIHSLSMWFNKKFNSFFFEVLNNLIQIF